MSERDQWLETAMARYETSLLRMCFTYLGDVQLAEDAVQDTFLKAYQRFSSYRGESSEKTWLMSIAINTCKDVLRSAWFRRVDRGQALDGLPEPAVPFQEPDDTLVRAVMALERRQREVILLRYYQDMSAQEIAAALGISVRAVYSRQKKALDTLQQHLAKQEEEYAFG